MRDGVQELATFALLYNHPPTIKPHGTSEKR